MSRIPYSVIIALFLFLQQVCCENTHRERLDHGDDDGRQKEGQGLSSSRRRSERGGVTGEWWSTGENGLGGDNAAFEWRKRGAWLYDKRDMCVMVVDLPNCCNGLCCCCCSVVKLSGLALIHGRPCRSRYRYYNV